MTQLLQHRQFISPRRFLRVSLVGNIKAGTWLNMPFGQCWPWLNSREEVENTADVERRAHRIEGRK